MAADPCPSKTQLISGITSPALASCLWQSSFSLRQSASLLKQGLPVNLPTTLTGALSYSSLFVWDRALLILLRG
jgi:hypothetical protein